MIPASMRLRDVVVATGAPIGGDELRRCRRRMASVDATERCRQPSRSRPQRHCLAWGPDVPVTSVARTAAELHRPSRRRRDRASSSGCYVLYDCVSSLTGDDGGDAARCRQRPRRRPLLPVVTLERPARASTSTNQSIYANEDDWQRTIVDTMYALPDAVRAARPRVGVEARLQRRVPVRSIIADDLNAMRNAILAADVPEVAILAGYRTIDEQATLFAQREDEMGFDDAAKGTARPGHSEHHLGTTIDFRPIGANRRRRSVRRDRRRDSGWPRTRGSTDSSSATPKGEEDVTCYKYEPWHFRYVGVDLAARVHQSGLTLREYLWHWEVTGHRRERPRRRSPRRRSPPTADDRVDG